MLSVEDDTTDGISTSSSTITRGLVESEVVNPVIASVDME